MFAHKFNYCSFCVLVFGTNLHYLDSVGLFGWKSVFNDDQIRVSSDPIFLYISYFIKILLYFLYLPKISYISSQNPIFFQNYEKKS